MQKAANPHERSVFGLNLAIDFPSNSH